MKLFTKPSKKGAIEMVTSQVYLSRLGGQKFRLVGVPCDGTVKVRPYRGQWPLILSMVEIDPDEVGYDTTADVLFAVVVEAGSSWAWHFASDAVLNVIEVT